MLKQLVPIILLPLLLSFGCNNGLSQFGDSCPDGSAPGKNGCDGIDTAIPHTDTDTDTETDTETDTDSNNPVGDKDKDGFTTAQGDCDDSRADVYPGAADTKGDGTDQNCDGVDGVDADGDGFASTTSGGEDCDDTKASVYPGATDPDGDNIDQNCDGSDGSLLCTDTCADANNGKCNDAGVGSSYTETCEFGTDCTDCGPRNPCVNTCTWAGDGVCDDGGPGSSYDACPLGTDCDDCGARP